MLFCDNCDCGNHGGTICAKFSGKLLGRLSSTRCGDALEVFAGDVLEGFAGDATAPDRGMLLGMAPVLLLVIVPPANAVVCPLKIVLLGAVSPLVRPLP